MPAGIDKVWDGKPYEPDADFKEKISNALAGFNMVCSLFVLSSDVSPFRFFLPLLSCDMSLLSFLILTLFTCLRFVHTILRVLM